MYDVTDGKMEKSDPKVFWESPSQCIYSMVIGFFDPRYPWYFIFHGIYLWFFYPFSFLGVLTPLKGFLTLFWKRVVVNHNKCSSFLHLWEGIMMFWTIFGGNTIAKVKNEGNMVGI